MKTLDPAVLASRQSRAGTSAHGLIWISAKDRTTGAVETIGFWTGDDHATITINEQGRTYYGAGNCLDIGDSDSAVGLSIVTRTVTLTSLSPEVQQAVKGYDARLAPVEMHRAEYDTDTGNLLAEPERIFKGWIDQIDFSDDAKATNGTLTSTCTLTLASSSRALTRTLAQKFSDASQRLRSGSDSFFQYVDLTASIDVFWGDKRVAATAVSTPTNILTSLLAKIGAI